MAARLGCAVAACTLVLAGCGREPPKARAKAPVRRKKPARPSARAAEFYAAFQRLVGEVFRINGRLLDASLKNDRAPLDKVPFTLV